LPQNTNAVGAKINVYVQGQILSKELIPARGFQSSVDYKQIFGLGQFKKIDSVQVIWPNLTQSILRFQKLDTVYTIEQAAQVVKPYFLIQEKVAPLFEEVKNNFEKLKNNFICSQQIFLKRTLPKSFSLGLLKKQP
jgi:hypothetical protein